MLRILVIIGLAFLASPAQALSLKVNVVGFAEFCVAHPALCQAGPAQRLPYNQKLRSLLDQVNRQVNKEITYSDTNQAEWRLNPKRGDCEDYAITKADRLMKAGLPREALHLALVQIRYPRIMANGQIVDNFETHMVLMIYTSAGDFILDNLSGKIIKRDESPYLFFAEERSIAGRIFFYSLKKDWAEFMFNPDWTALCGFDCEKKKEPGIGTEPRY